MGAGVEAGGVPVREESPASEPVVVGSGRLPGSTSGATVVPPSAGAEGGYAST